MKTTWLKLFSLFLGCFVLLLFTSCGKNNTHEGSITSGKVRWASFPIGIYVDSYLLSDASAKKDLEDAMQFWENKTGKHLFQIQGGWNNGIPVEGSLSEPDSLKGNVIYFMGPWQFFSSAAGNTILMSDQGIIQNSVVFINAEKVYCEGNCATQTNEISRRKLFAHELGHFLGLGHVSETGNIMYPSIEHGADLDSVNIDISALQSVID
ncbi:MAG: matrixin family metalloprotease [Oligoflexia bacterium]|nr:matrixin family metalloprotease [Oligoflexia bacterium]